MRNLIIGGIEVSLRASELLTQSYTPVQAVARLRMASGTLKQQTSWSGKQITEIEAEGALPAGLQALDYSQEVLIKCIDEKVQ